MPVIKTENGPVWLRRTPRASLRLWAAWFVFVALTVWCWQVMTKDTIWAFVYDAPQQAADIGSRMFPPRLSYIEKLLWPLWDTINMATLGTMLGVVIATPVAFLAARNTTPSLLIARPIALFIIVASRSINSLIWALLLVAVIGPGVFAGLLAIAFRSIGFCAKLLYEAIEEIDPTQVEAITATGASRWQVMAYGIVPQIMPAFAGIIAIALRSIGFVGKLLYEAIEETELTQIEAVQATGASGAQLLNYGYWPQIAPAFWGISVFRWDINIRESAVLGLVGAGGLGLQLQASLSVLAWPQVTTILLVILATVVFSEWVSAKVRHAII
jgi:phosphonate transport system permease protein